MELDSYLSDKQKKKKRWRIYGFFIIVLVVAYVLFAGILWIILRSPFFRVNTIVVRGNDTVPTSDIIALLESSALRDHSFWKAMEGIRSMFIWPSSLSADDLVFIPRVAAITVSKNYFSRTITVTVAERRPFAIWCISPLANEQCYWFDDTGTIFGKTFDTEGSLTFAIHDYSTTSLGLGKNVLPDIFVSNLISIINAIRTSGLDVKEIALKDIGLQEIDMMTYNGPDVYFSLRFSADNDLPVLQSLMAKPDFAQLQYVDFRVENRAYYK